MTSDSFPWPDGAPRIVVSDAWLANSGDAAIALATDALLRDLAPQAAIVHAAYQHDLFGRHLRSLQLVPSIEELLAPGRAEGRALLGSADLLVSQGGGFLMDEFQPWGRLGPWLHAIEVGVPLVVLGQSLGPVRTASARRDLRRALSGASLVVLRDAASAAHVADLDAAPRSTIVATDAVFAADWCHVGRGADAGGPIGVVLSAEDPRPERRAARRDEAVDVLGAVVELARRSERRVLAWSTVQGSGDLGFEDDRRLVAEVIARCGSGVAEVVDVVDGHLPPDACLALIAGLAALVTTRLHPALLAAIVGVPFLLVTDDPKGGVLAGSALGAAVASPSAFRTGDAGAALLSQLRPSAPEDLAGLRARFDPVRAELAALLS